MNGLDTANPADQARSRRQLPIPDQIKRGKPARSTLFGILRVICLILIVIGCLGLIFILPPVMQNRGLIISSLFIDYLMVMLLGMLVGFVEVISRYQDAPFRTASTWPALFYMLVNAGVAAAALWLVRLFDWQFIPGGQSDVGIARWAQVLVAGLGAMAIFRSSLLVIGKEDEEVSIGPSAVLEILLNAIDKEVDRFRGQERAKIVKEIMKDVHYDDAVKDLSVLSKALLQNLRPEDSAKIDEVRKQIEIISDIDPEVRKYLLGLRIMDVVGEDVLRQAIGIRGQEYYKQALDRRQKESLEKATILANLSAVGESLKGQLGPEPSQTGGTQNTNFILPQANLEEQPASQDQGEANTQPEEPLSGTSDHPVG